MATRWEGADASMTSVQVAGPGTALGEDTVPAGQAAVVFAYDEVFVLQGTRDRLRDLLFQALEDLEHLD